MTPSRTRRQLITGAAAVGAAGLVPSWRPARAATRIRAGYIPVLGSSALFVLIGERWDVAAGLEIELVRFESGPVMLQAFAAGQLDLYVGGVSPLMVGFGKGMPARVVAALATGELVVAARGALAQAFRETSQLAAAVAAFTAATGRKPKFATQPPGSVPDAILRYWIDQVSGVPLDAVELVGMGIDATQEVFLTGGVDGATVREPTLTLIRARDPAVVLVATGGEMLANQPGAVVAVWQPEKRDWVLTLVRMIIRATRLLTEDPKRAAPLIARILGGDLVPVFLIERALASPATRFISNPAIILESTQKLLDYQVNLGVVARSIPVGPAFDLDTYVRAAS